MCETKTCTKCGKTLPISEFPCCSRNSDGLGYRCKSCNNEYYRTHNGAIRAAKRSAAVTPRELMEELAKRGYTGKLHAQITKPWEKLSEALQAALEKEGLQGATVVLDKDIDITNF